MAIDTNTANASSASTTSAIIGVFDSDTKAEQAAQELVESGIRQDSIHVQSSAKTATQEHEGGIRGFFHNLFGGDEHEDTGHYSQAVDKGQTVLIVRTPDQQIDHVVALLNQYGAIDVNDDAAGYARTGYADADNTKTEYADPKTGFTDAAASGQSIPVVEEQITVGKRAVQRGGVRIYSHVVDRPVAEQVTLRDEHVRVERRPVDRELTEAEVSGLRDQSFEMTETVEEPVVEKRARVKEEVVLGKETTQRTETIHDSVRQTEIKVEKFGNSGHDSGYDSDFRNDWQKNYASQGGDYEAYAPSYDYGYQYGNDPRYKGRSWDQVEAELRSGYERDNPGSSWEKVKQSVRYGWDKVTGK